MLLGIVLKRKEPKMKFLWQNIMKNKWIAFLGVFLKTLATFAELTLPAILQLIVDDVAPKGDLNRILMWGVAMVVLSVLAFILNINGNRLASQVARNSTRSIRHALFEHTVRLSASDADRFTVPSLESRITSDTYNIHQFTGMILRMGIRAPILLVGGVVMTLFIDPVLTLVMVALLPLIAISVIFISGKGVPLYTKTQQKLDKLVGVMRENAIGIRVVKALTKYDYETRRFDDANREHNAMEKKAAITMGAVNPIVSLILNIGTAIVVLLGAYRVGGGYMKAGAIIAFIQYFTQIINAMLAVTRIFVMYSKASASANRVKEIIDTEEELSKESNEEYPDSENRDLHVEFKDVSFSYTGKKNNVKNVSFSLRKGERMGIIGATGSGKSTLMLLLMRFYDVSEGAIYVNGKDVRTYDKNVLRRMFGVALQNDFIKNGTIAENVSFDRDLSHEQIERGARLAQAEEFITGKEGGYDFVLNSKGTNLSGGQRQRILVSRALAGNPDLLILDDSSSALDYKTDAALRSAVFENMKGTTVFIVAQRVSSVMNCNRILVLDDGDVVDLGSHDELMERCEVYREISLSQMGGEVE